MRWIFVLILGLTLNLFHHPTAHGEAGRKRRHKRVGPTISFARAPECKRTLEFPNLEHSVAVDKDAKVLLPSYVVVEQTEQDLQRAEEFLKEKYLFGLTRHRLDGTYQMVVHASANRKFEVTYTLLFLEGGTEVRVLTFEPITVLACNKFWAKLALQEGIEPLAIAIKTNHPITLKGEPGVGDEDRIPETFTQIFVDPSVRIKLLVSRNFTAKDLTQILGRTKNPRYRDGDYVADFPFGSRQIRVSLVFSRGQLHLKTIYYRDESGRIDATLR